jgi:hypothetical protein
MSTPGYRRMMDARIRAAITERDALRGRPTTPSAIPAESILPVADQARFGDMQTLPVTVTAAGNVAALDRPSFRRVLLIVNNLLVGNTINFAFDRAADAVTGVPIIAGGNVFFDNAVPQGQLNVFIPVAGTILVSFINAEV